MTDQHYQAVVIGCSAGGLEALRRVLGPLPETFPAPILAVVHMGADGGDRLAELLDNGCALTVTVAEEKEIVQPGRVYVAPGGYHLLVEADRTLSLSVDERVCNVRPSANILFESAADTWGDRLIGVILTGANSDGASGLAAIKRAGGYAIVQDPDGAVADAMPRAAIAIGGVDRVAPLDQIAGILLSLFEIPETARPKKPR